MDHLLTEIASTFNLKRKSGKYVGPCPKCGGSASSDKFNIKDDGGFKCYSCDFKGDIITWLREIDGMSCPEAHVAANVECRASACPVADNFRFGSGGSGSGKKRKFRSVAVSTNKNSKLPTPTVKNPTTLCSDWATQMIAKGEANIQEEPEVLAWLAGRGIDAYAIKRFRLGWLKHDYRPDRQTIGVAVEGDKKHLWVPAGLLIPIFTLRGEIHRIRMRRTNEAREKFAENLKYLWLKGSGTHPMVIRPLGMIRGVVVVEAELDAIAVAMAHDQVMVIAVGSASAGIPDPLRSEIATIAVILIGLDADPGEDGKRGPGAAASKIWTNQYRQAKYWPVMVGKDPGDLVASGGDLYEWVEGGLVPELPASPDPVEPSGDPRSQDFACSPGLYRRGEGEDQFSEVKTNLVEPCLVTDDLERLADLKNCPVCLGDLFLHGQNGGYFCVGCQPVGVVGRLVRAARTRGHYVVG